MNDIQTWRFSTQRTRVRPAETLNNELPPSDGTPLSTSPTENAIRPRPRRSLASFTTYLNTHRIVSSIREPRWPTVDWSNLEGKDEVYKPDLELTCSTLHKHVLINPSKELPACYNSFLMQLLEDYHQLKIEKKQLEAKLKAETECHSADTEEFHRALIFWSSEGNVGLPNDTARRPTLLAGQEDVKTFTKPGSRAGVAPLSKLDHSRSGQNFRDDKGTTVKARFKASKYHKCLPPSRRRTNTGTPARGIHGPTRNLLQASETGEFDDDTTSAGSDFSSDEEDELSGSTPYDRTTNSDPSIALRSRNKLSLPEGYAPERVPWEVKLLPIPSCSPAHHSTMNKVTQPISARVFGNTFIAGKPQNAAQSSMDMDDLQHSVIVSKSGHRRGFSFAPGDDSTDSAPFKETSEISIRSQGTASTPLAVVADNGRPRDQSHESLGNESISGSALKSRPYRHLSEGFHSVSDLGESPKLPERYGSGKSVLTAFKGSSGGSPSLSHGGSMSSMVDNDVVMESVKQKGDSHFFAIAAARAAKNVSLNVKPTQRQVGA